MRGDTDDIGLGSVYPLEALPGDDLPPPTIPFAVVTAGVQEVSPEGRPALARIGF